MTLKVHQPNDADLNILTSSRIGVIGYGNQGHAHALNLRDAGLQVLVGQRKGKGFDRAQSDGFEPCSISEAAQRADLLILALPDELAALIFEEQIRPHLRSGQTLGFVHGFNIHYGFIAAPGEVDVIMVAPKGPGTLLRSLFQEDKGLPALFAIHQDVSGQACKVALAWAAGIGCSRAGVLETTFACETETDLFGEQAVLCGGVSALTKAAFETLVDAGYAPEFAYLECVHELKQTVDLLYHQGLAGMRQRISNTAAYGDVTRGPQLINEDVRRTMQRVLDEIRSGAFAKEWIDEVRSGSSNFDALCKADENTPFDKTGQKVRSMMPWLGTQP